MWHRRLVLPSLGLLIFALLTGCSDSDSGSNPTGPDENPLATVDDLTSTSAASTSVNLRWTTPDSDPVLYDIRFANGQLDESNWADAESWEGGVSSIGTESRAKIDGLTPQSQYRFALRTSRDGEIWSEISNSVVANTAPSLIPAASANGTIAALLLAYLNGDLPTYESLLADDFTFVFDATDRAEDPTLPVSWNLERETAATQGLFGSDDLLSLDLAFIAAVAVDPEPGDNAPANTKRIDVTQVQLEVVIDDSEGGEPVSYLVDGDAAEFFLREVPNGLGNGNSSWEIVEWRDHRTEGLTVDLSWGAVKAIFE